MKYSTKNIFVDTNIIESNNFFHGTYFQSLLHYSRSGIINLYMTSVSKMELINRMKIRLIESKEEHNKLVKSLNKPKSRILKNFIQYQDLELSPIKIEESLNELIKKLELIIESANIKIIDTKNINIEEIFELFYFNMPPFGQDEKKKYEFPDAFIVKSIDTWCIANKKKMIFLTKDNDFNGYKSRHLLFKKDIVKTLEEITQYFDSIQEKQLIPYINNQIEVNKVPLLDLINVQLKEMVLFDIDYEKTSKLELSYPILKSFKIISIRDNYAELACVLEVRYKYIIIPSIHDIDRYIFNDSFSPKRISDVIDIPCDLEINLKKENDIKIKWINSNQKVRIILK